MLIKKLNARGKAAVILGAGASRGASYVNTLLPVKPPLDRDFFNQVQALPDGRHGKIVRDLLTVARDEFGPDLKVTMEEFFTHVEFLDEFHSRLKVDRGPRRRTYREIQETFLHALTAVLAASTEGFACEYHDVLAAALRPGDTVLSFNYDTLIDRALKARAGNRWRASQGYGVPVVDGCSDWEAQPAPGPPARVPIRLLKMHGSLNWQRSDNGTGILLKTQPYDPERILVIPPAWKKPITEDPVFSSIWKAARFALRQASILVVVGYSVPVTDMLARALLRVEATVPTSEQLRYLVLANPDGLARGSMVRLLGGAVSSRTRVVWVENLKELRHLIG